MKRQNNGGSTRGRAKELPQVFVGGQYRGVSDEPTILLNKVKETTYNLTGVFMNYFYIAISGPYRFHRRR
jgi:hypothetical protein